MARPLKTVSEIHLTGNPGRLTPVEIAARRAEEGQPLAPIGPAPLSADTRPPRGLGKVARRKFKELVARQVFCDVETAEMFARLFERARAAEADVIARGRVLESERGFKANPSVRELNDAEKLMASLLVRYARQAPIPGEEQTPALKALTRLVKELRR